jgi:hypothetical protein
MAPAVEDAYFFLVEALPTAYMLHAFKGSSEARTHTNNEIVALKASLTGRGIHDLGAAFVSKLYQSAASLQSKTFGDFNGGSNESAGSSGRGSAADEDSILSGSAEGDIGKGRSSSQDSATFKASSSIYSSRRSSSSYGSTAQAPGAGSGDSEQSHLLGLTDDEVDDLNDLEGDLEGFDGDLYLL